MIDILYLFTQRENVIIIFKMDQLFAAGRHVFRFLSKSAPPIATRDITLHFTTQSFVILFVRLFSPGRGQACLLDSF